MKFFTDFQAKWNHDPIYTASGTYDAVKLLNKTMVENQTISNDWLIPKLEEIDLSNPYMGVGGNIAFTPNHDLVAGLPNVGIALWTQWQAGGTKAVINGPFYDGTYFGTNNHLNTSVLQVPEWIDDAWDTT